MKTSRLNIYVVGNVTMPFKVKQLWSFFQLSYYKLNPTTPGIQYLSPIERYIAIRVSFHGGSAQLYGSKFPHSARDLFRGEQ